MKKRLFSALLVLLMLLTSVPVFAADAADTSWYQSGKTSFELSTAAQLLGLSKLSNDGNTFKGVTITLKNDIALNSGDVKNAASAPANVWTPLKNFAGTIDGKGFAISGIYATGESVVGFIGTADGATVKNLSITNSYFATTSGNTVSAFIAQGATAAELKLEKCYTDAKIVSAQYNAGGFVASVGNAAKTTASECWFDGTIEIKVRYAAGIIANGEGKQVFAEHCLNTGTVYTSHTESANSHIAGIVGRNDGNSTVIDCLNIGKITTARIEAGNGDAIGALFGRCSGNGTVTVKNSAALQGSAPADSLLGSQTGPLVSENIGAGAAYSTEAELKGLAALTYTYLDFVSYWTPVTNGYPMLRVFADDTVEVPEVSVPVFEENQIRVDSDYALRFIFSFDGDLSEAAIGALVIPTVAYKKVNTLVHEMAPVAVGNKTYEAKDVPAEILWDEGEGYVEYTVAITDIDLSSARSGFTVRPYAIYEVNGEEIVLYGEAVDDSLARMALSFYDGATKDEKAAFDAVKVLKDVYESFVDFPARDGWETEGSWITVPAFIGGTLSDPFIVGEDRFDLDCDAYLISDTTLQMFKDYVASLKKHGFTLHADNGADGIDGMCYQATLYNNDQAVNVTYYEKAKKTYVTVEALRDLSPNQKPQDFSSQVIKDQQVSLYMAPLKAFGESMIFQLANGHFVIVDGAQEKNSELTVEYLVENAPAGQKPVVDAWVFTHAHPDHIYCAMGIGSNADWVNKIVVEGFYYTWPNDAGVRKEAHYADLCNQISTTAAALKNFKNAAGEVTPQYKIHGGQRYYFTGLEIQVLSTQDQLFPEEYRGGFNDSSTSYRFIFGDQDFLIMGDAHHPVCTRLMEFYDTKTLSPTFFQSLHHTGNDVPDFFKYIDPQYFVVTGNSIGGGSGHTWLKENVDKIFYAGDLIPIPYAQ